MELKPEPYSLSRMECLSCGGEIAATEDDHIYVCSSCYSRYLLNVLIEEHRRSTIPAPDPEPAPLPRGRGRRSIALLILIAVAGFCTALLLSSPKPRMTEAHPKDLPAVPETTKTLQGTRK